ncbi:MAG: hypothetical protein HY046_04835 [Acidobacteria bacterium]|nr:hypothetical protein [Acidobacteriota bacterium]
MSTKTKVTRAEIPALLDSTAAQLVEQFNKQARAIRSINARVELNPVAGSAYSGVIEDYRDVRGFILAQRPANIRMIGQAPVIAKTIFDMVSDGDTFRISIPTKNKFITGPAQFERAAKKPIENLRPNHLTDAIFWNDLPANVLFEEFEAEAASAKIPAKRYYILSELRGEGPAAEIARKVWFDRSDLRLARIQIFGPRGRVVTDARYADWQPADENQGAGGADLRYPRQIHVGRPLDDYRLEIRITRLTLNESIAPERFQLAQPPGAELVRVGEEEKKNPR